MSEVLIVPEAAERPKIRYPVRAILLLAVMFAFVLLAVFLRGGSGLKSLLGLKHCTDEYWIFTLCYTISSLGLMGMTSFLLVRKEKEGKATDEEVSWSWSACIRLICIGVIAGLLTGGLGLTGGVFIAPLLLTLGVRPEVSASTCTLLVFFTSSIAFVQFATAGMVIYDYGLFYFFAAVAGSLIGVTLVEKAMERRKSIGIFVLSLVLGLSTVLISVHGGLRTYEKISREEMQWGFRPFCRPRVITH